MTQWIEFDTALDVASAAADTIEEHARHAITQRGEFKIVLAGGTTPKSCYEILAGRSLDRAHWKVFYGDERCLSLKDIERNHQMVTATGLTDQIAQHYIMPAELGPVKGAELYQLLIDNQAPFDMVLLGMGEDGHTASLFPGLDWENADSSAMVLPVQGAPKPPSERISLSPAALQNCRQMLVLISGKSKQQAVHRWLDGETMPIAIVADCDQSAVLIEKGLME